MRIRLWIVRALLRVYPFAWRREYGPELAEILLTRALDVGTISNVLWNGLRQRVRAAEPATLFGLAAMLVILTGLGWNIAAPSSSGHGLAPLLEESSKTLPTVIVKPLASELYVLFLVGCGYWTHLRYSGKLSKSGLAAIKVSFIAGIPVMLVGVLMLAGVVNDNALHQSLPPLAVLTAPLFKLPESWIWGMVGGQLGRGISRTRRRQTAGS